MLFARVCSKRTSDSLKAFSRSTFCRLTYPLSSLPTIIGTKRLDLVNTVPGTVMAPNSAMRRSASSLMRIVWRVRIMCCSSPVKGDVGNSTGLPNSTPYSNVESPVPMSRVVMVTTCASKIS